MQREVKNLVLSLAFGIIFLFSSIAFAQGPTLCTSTRQVPTATYPTIQSATNNAPSGTCVVVSPGAYQILNWFYVPVGVKLILPAGTTVDFLHNCTIDGCLETQGTRTVKVYLNFGHNLGLGCYGQLKCTNTIFANYSQGSTWDGVWLMGDKVGTNRTSGSVLDSCIISGVKYSLTGAGAALWILDSYDVTVKFCKIQNLVGNSTTGIYIEGSKDIHVYKNYLKNNREGLVGNFDSFIYFGSASPLGPNDGNNIITGNSDAGILAHHRTTIFLDPYYWNYNDISGNGGYAADLWDHSTIYARGNYWGVYPPNVTYDPTSYIDYSSPLSSPPVLNLSTGFIENNNPINIGGMLNKAINTSSDDELLKAFELLSLKDYTEALNIFKSIALTSKDNVAVYAQALSGISTISKITGDKDLLKYLKDESKNAIAKLTYASTLVGFGSYDEAISEYEAVAKSYPGTNYEIQALVKISYTYLLYKKDLVKAEEILDKVTKVAGSKVDPNTGYYKDEDVSVRFLRGMVDKQTYGSNWPGEGRLVHVIASLMDAKEYTELANLSKGIISSFETDPNSVAGGRSIYGEALNSIAYLCVMSRDENFAKNFELDSKELFEYLKARTKDNENATVWERLTYAGVLGGEQAISEYEDILKMPSLGYDEYGISLRLTILQHIKFIYQGLNDPNRVKETNARIDKLINGVTSVEKPTELPTEYSISQNYPNPFNPTTTIQFAIPKDEYVKLVVYDVTGKVVTELVNGYKSAGRYNVEFNASGYASGIYYYRIEAGAYKSVQKMMLIK